jgi:hypothetical protein
MLIHLLVLHQETAIKINRSINTDNKNIFVHVTTATVLWRYTNSVFAVHLTFIYRNRGFKSPTVWCWWFDFNWGVF